VHSSAHSTLCSHSRMKGVRSIRPNSRRVMASPF
jgi:hypothetical protein